MQQLHNVHKYIIASSSNEFSRATDYMRINRICQLTSEVPTVLITIAAVDKIESHVIMNLDTRAKERETSPNPTQELHKIYGINGPFAGGWALKSKILQRNLK